MPSLTTIASTLSAAFLASFVEAVEAFTVVLAVAITRSWRPAVSGSLLALAALGLLVVALGPLLNLVPLHLLQLGVGVLLMLFGMRWLRKAILRAAGVIALHDEAKAFAEESDLLKRRAEDRRADFLAGLAAFKAVLLEGLEVVFIVIAVGAGRGLLGYAGLGAAGACLAVVAFGMHIRHPLSRVPENTLKFAVGLMLTSFGVFWAGEGLGAAWPGEDGALIAIAAVLLLVALGCVRLLRARLDAAAPLPE